jgi:hypothetical protein
MARVRPLDCWADKNLSDRTNAFSLSFQLVGPILVSPFDSASAILARSVLRRCTVRAVAVPHCCTYRGIRPATTSTASIALALQAARNGCPSEKQGSAALYLCLGRQSSDRSFGDHRVRELAYGGATPRCILRREKREFVPRPNPSPLNELAHRPSAAADFCNKICQRRTPTLLHVDPTPEHLCGLHTKKAEVLSISQKAATVPIAYAAITSSRLTAC